MAIVLTGGTGLLGANLAHVLREKGVRPRILVRERSDRRGLFGIPHDEVEGDVLDRASLDRAFAGASEVYHLAGSVTFDPFSGQRLRDLHLRGTENVLEAAKARGVRRVVVASTIAAVGHGPLHTPATEETTYNYEGSNPYHESKREAETLALSYASKGLEVVAGCPSFIVGAYDVRPSSGELLLLVAKGLMLFYPSGGINVVNADDVARGFQLLMERGRSGERYIIGGQNLTYREFLTIAAEEVGVRPPLFPVPEKLTLLGGKIGDLVGHASPELFRFANSSFLRSLFLLGYVSSGKAQREVGYRPRQVRFGIREAYRWFQEQGAIARDRPLTPRGEQV